LVEITCLGVAGKADEKFNRRHVVDIPMIFIFRATPIAGKLAICGWAPAILRSHRPALRFPKNHLAKLLI
jgi:hypothetical protein